jgi:Mannosyltransferase (PIG-V)
LQVLTRFLTSCPALYFFAAHAVVRGPAWRTRAVLAYCALWAWLGVALFPNFYPWT